MSTRSDIPAGIKSAAKTINDAAVASSEWQPYDVSKLNAMAADILKIGTTEEKRENELDNVIYK